MPPSNPIKQELFDVEGWQAQRRANTRNQRRRRRASVIEISEDSNNEIEVLQEATGSKSAPAEPRTTLRPEIVGRRSQSALHPGPPLPQRSLDTIELTSDEEYVRGRDKRIKLADEDEDGDEEYYAGYDMNDPVNWKPLPWSDSVQPSDMDTHVELKMPERPRRIFGNNPQYVSPTPRGNARHLPWNFLPFTARPTQQVIASRQHSTFFHQPVAFAQMLGLCLFVPMAYTGCNSQTSGSVNKILQTNGQIIACSAAIAGEADNGHVRHDHQNTPGSLVAIYQGKVHYPQGGHEQFSNNGTLLKTYTVNDIALNPLQSNILASSGHDKSIRFWQVGTEAPGLTFIQSISHDHIPHDVSFKPDSELLSAAFSNGDIVLYPSLSEEDSVILNLAQGQPVGATAWGSNLSSDLLFASSEPVDGQRGYHQAFDINKRVAVLTFDAEESGDALAVDPNGNHMVLITHCTDGSHLLRLYDVQNRIKTSTSTLTLDPVVPAGEDQSGEINCLTYSPDGLYIATARNDGATHVYDVRMLDHGPVSRFRHHRRSETASPSYGVVRAQWVENHWHRLALVTGGDDGDVRLWDPLQSDSNPTNGQVLAHSDWDIAHFVVGNLFQNEKPLIIGDSGGRITVYDSPAEMST